MKRPVVHRAVAEEGDRHLVGLVTLKLFGPRGLEDARPHDAAGSHQADLWCKQMHRSPAALRAARRAAEELGEQLTGCHPFRQCVPVAAMSAEDHVVGSQVGDHARGNSLLADVCVAGAMNQALLVCPRELLLTAADQEHHLQETQKLFPLQRRRHHSRDPLSLHLIPGGRTYSERPELSDPAHREW